MSSGATGRRYLEGILFEEAKSDAWILLVGLNFWEKRSGDYLVVNTFRKNMILDYKVSSFVSIIEVHEQAPLSFLIESLWETPCPDHLLPGE